MKKLLLVEDDLILGETIKEALEEEGFDVVWVKDGEQALDATYVGNFDLFLLDVNIPFISGFELLKELRKSGDKTPAIFITALTDIRSLSKGFETGADDYIKKPFDIDELIVRINALIKKSFNSYSDKITYGDMEFYIKDERIIKDSREIFLSPYERKLFSLFIKNIGRNISKEEIFEELYTDYEISEGSLRVHISRLKKTGLNIINIRGIGYRCEEEAVKRRFSDEKP